MTKGDNPRDRKSRKEIQIKEASITNRIQVIEGRISGAEDTIENIDTAVKENAKCKKVLTQNIQDIQETMRKPNLRVIETEQSEDFLLKEPNSTKL
jgi:DNA-binding FrmR family transcriptional regulator